MSRYKQTRHVHEWSVAQQAELVLLFTEEKGYQSIFARCGKETKKSINSKIWRIFTNYNHQGSRLAQAITDQEIYWPPLVGLPKWNRRTTRCLAYRYISLNAQRADYEYPPLTIEEVAVLLRRTVGAVKEEILFRFRKAPSFGFEDLKPAIANTDKEAAEKILQALADRLIDRLFKGLS